MAPLRALAAAAVLAYAGAKVVSSAAGKGSAPRTYKTSSVRDPTATVNVHIVPHTHDDVGWLKTVDQYGYGANNSIQHANVFSIISAAVRELAVNPDRKFIYVEQAFFTMWWEEQDDTTRTLVKELVSTGQLEFINGGWSMHDEANPTYIDMIDNTALGHRLIMENFGVAPKATWQIDPFGHSGFQAYAMSSPMSGFSSVFFARSDFEDDANRKKNLSTEWAWFPSPSLGRNAGTLGGILADYYYGPSGFNFGGDDSAPPIIDNPQSTEYNVPNRIAAFIDTIQSFVNFTRPNKDGSIDVMIMMATDFSYENAVTWFRNIDKLQSIINAGTAQHGVHTLYSTPSIYAAAKTSGTILPQRTDDMFVYRDGPHAGWSGYFTSRTALKHYIRDTSAHHQAYRQAQAFGSPPGDMSPANPLYLLERAIGITQHHDAVAGTSKQHVANDYAQRLSIGRADGASLFSEAVGILSGAMLPWATCDLANATICSATEAATGPVLVALWNSQGQARTNVPVRIPVGFPAGVASYAVVDNTGASVIAQTLPLSATDVSLRGTYYNVSNGNNVQWLAFTATLPPAGYAIYAITPSATLEGAPNTHASTITVVRAHPDDEGSDSSSSKRFRVRAAQTITNGVVTVSFDATTGLVNGLTTATANTALAQTFWYYNSSNFGGPDDQTGDSGQPSGAYIFRPNSSTPFPVSAATSNAALTIVSGPVVSEARQVWDGNWASQVVRVWAGMTSGAEFEWTIGPIPHADGLGKEIITRYTTPLATNGEWVSDSNCRDSMRRKRDYRPTWNITIYEPVADNYVPVNCFQSIADASTGVTLTVATDRSNGGSSIVDGSLEIMVHRRLLRDDNRGVGEPLNETGINGLGLIARGVHLVSLDSAATAGVSRRTNVANQLSKHVVAFTALPAGSTAPQWLQTHNSSYAGVAALPANVHLLTVQAYNPRSWLVRLAHSYEAGEDAVNSQPATVSLATLFTGFSVTGATEMTLTGNMPLVQAPAVTYNLDDGTSVTLPVIPAPPQGAAMSVTLNPMEIRTFLVTVAQI